MNEYDADVAPAIFSPSESALEAEYHWYDSSPPSVDFATTISDSDVSFSTVVLCEMDSMIGFCTPPPLVYSVIFIVCTV